MNIRYIVELDEEERKQLQELTGAGKARVRRVKRAQILLAAEQGHGDAMVTAMVGVGTSTVYRTKCRFVEQGVCGEKRFRDRFEHAGILVKCFRNCRQERRNPQSMHPEANEAGSSVPVQGPE